LIVEDHEDSREGYAQYFRYRGVRVVTAADGREALDLASRLSPDVVVMDLAMPRMNGWKAIQELRARSRTRDVRILALSAHAAYEDEMKAWRSGTDAFRAKPCMPDELLEEIERLLQRTGGGPAGAAGSGSGGRSPSRTTSRGRRSVESGGKGNELRHGLPRRRVRAPRPPR
jgi:DNA-binding response OmpR family regulator